MLSTGSIKDIEKAIGELSLADRDRLVLWISELGAADRVAESAPAYGYGAVPQGHNLSVEEYLRFEESAQSRHEYIAGEIYAMTGASDTHNRISLNVSSTLHSRLKGGTCRVYMAEFKVKLRIADEDIFYYPDVMVSCHPGHIGQYHTAAPTLIVEVLSRSTEAIDRREKMMNYRQAQTLEEYCLIAQDRQEVTILRRTNRWRAEIFSLPDDLIEFRCVQQTMSLAEIYADVRW